jgi:RNA-directed DNA polymerase
VRVNQRWDEPVPLAKPFGIAKKLVWEAWLRVRANGGAAGVDGETIEEFERNLSGNLYRLWNRMSSGTYFPQPVREVEIPKRDGGMRSLGIPTITDRITQTVVKIALEPEVEPQFHPDSYGYRPGKSAVEAVGKARERCWRQDWVVDLDIRAFFDSLDHDLLLRAVRKYTQTRWVLLYIERWLKTPVQRVGGSLDPRVMGTPQGGVISPLLANIFLHLAFDTWMQREFPAVRFERYADDVLAHCSTEKEAHTVLAAVTARLAQCRLQVHPQKTKIVYCKDSNRRGQGAEESFDFLGFTFRPRRARNRDGQYFASFSPAISRRAAKEIRATMRRNWRIRRRTDKSLIDLARMFNPEIRGWIQYYGSFHRSALYSVFRSLDFALVKWAVRKFKRLRGHQRRASRWLARIAKRDAQLFAHWHLLPRKATTG